MTTYKWGFLMLICASLCPLSSSSSADAWTGGGAYDGYNWNFDRVDVGLPHVNNARGATNVTQTATCLNGYLLNTGSAPAEVHVYWGNSDGGTTRTAWSFWTNFGTCGEGILLTTNIAVQSGLTYYYRFHATNTIGEVGWASQAARFVTPGPPILTAAAGAAPVGHNTASLNAALTAGIDTEVRVLWGINSNAWTYTNFLGTSSAPAALRLSVSNLTAGTVYAYRTTASNAYGVDQTAILVFTTLYQAVSFSGGGYDGFAQTTEQAPIRAEQGTIFMVY